MLVHTRIRILKKISRKKYSKSRTNPEKNYCVGVRTKREMEMRKSTRICCAEEKKENYNIIENSWTCVFSYVYLFYFTAQTQEAYCR